METRELRRVSREIQKLTQTNAECLVSAADVQAARARARALSSPRNTAAEGVKGNHHGRTSTPSTLIQLKGHHRSAITPRPAYRRSLNTANAELTSFREKFNMWKMTYDREIGKTKASLASMTPTLQGLGLAARMHKIANKAADSLNGSPPSSSGSLSNPTPSREESQTPNGSTDVQTTPRTAHSETMMEASMQPLQLDIDLLSITDEYPDFLDDDTLLSERAGKIAAVNDDIGVLTTIIEKKIFATHISNPVPHDVDNIEENAAAIDLCAWSEGELTARSIKMREDIAPPDHDGDADADHSDNEHSAVVDESTEVDSSQITTPAELDVSQTTTYRGVRTELLSTTKTRKSENLGADPPPRPVNLRDNLIILAKQKGFTHVGTPVNEVVPSPSAERERAMALLRKMYAPTTPSPITTQPPGHDEVQSKAKESQMTETTILQSQAATTPSISNSQNLDASSARPTPPEAAVLGLENMTSERVTRIVSHVASSMSTDFTLRTSNGELLEERNDSTTSTVSVGRMNNKLNVDYSATILDAPTVGSERSSVKNVSEVRRELVIGSNFRIDHGKPVNLYEGLDSGITIN